jgi:two-component system sensor histidine kinase RegB
MVNNPADLRHVVAWLPVVRWSTGVVLWTVFAVAWLFPHLDLPLRAIVALGLGAAVCRTLAAAAFHVRARAPRWLLGLSLVADAALLTGLLDITGGPFNPFIVMYVTYVWLAGVTVSPAGGGLVATAAAIGFGWLVIDHLQAGLLEHHRLNDFPTHLFTMWLAGAAVAELVAHYVTRARVVLAQRQQQLDEARDRAVRSERLASLTTLAAGAAHELSTPLATIAVAARELERNATRVSEPTGLVGALEDDARLIRSEVHRCQAIMERPSDGRGTDNGAARPERDRAAGAQPIDGGATASTAPENLSRCKDAEGRRRRNRAGAVLAAQECLRRQRRVGRRPPAHRAARDNGAP